MDGSIIIPRNKDEEHLQTKVALDNSKSKWGAWDGNTSIGKTN